VQIRYGCELDSRIYGILTYYHHYTESTTNITVTNVSLFYGLCISFVQNITQHHTIRIQLQTPFNASGQHIHTLQTNTQRSHGYEIICDAFLC